MGLAFIIIISSVGGCDENTGPDLVRCQCSCGEEGLPEQLPETGLGCRDAGDTPEEARAACEDICDSKEGTVIGPSSVECRLIEVIEVDKDLCTDEQANGTFGDPANARAATLPGSTIKFTAFLFSRTTSVDATAGTTKTGTTLVFNNLTAIVPDGSVLGVSVRQGTTLVQPFEGTIDSDGNYEVPARSVTILANARVGGVNVAFNATNKGKLTGIYNEATGEFTMKGTIDGPFGVEAKLDMEFEFLNRPPVADAGLDKTVECSFPGGATVELSGTATDPDDNLLDTRWFVNPNTPDAEILAGDNVDVDLPLGDHSAGFLARDVEGGRGFDDVEITVEDTTAPTLAFSGRVCLFPPNHKYVVLRVSRDFGGTDVCDPSAIIQIIGAQSDQPDNAEGDGETDNDLVVFADRICVRSERQGTVQVARTYRIDFAGVDAEDNSSASTIEVRVPHDQGDEDCPIVSPTEFVEFDDPLCEPESPDVLSIEPLEGTDDASGCSVGSGRSTNGLLFVLGFVLLLRRQGRRR